MSVQFIHLANLFSSASNDAFCMEKLRTGKITSLETFWKGNQLARLLDANRDIKIFLDSGAHSLLNAQVGLIGKGDIVKTNKKEGEETTFTEEEFNRLDTNQKILFAGKRRGTVQLFADWSFNKNSDVRKYLDNYIAFIHKYKNQLFGYVNLDIIYNAEASWENQQYMEKNGLKPIPVFHYSEDFKWLKFYAENYEYIGIGGMATGVTTKQFVTSLGDRAFRLISKANSEVKVHGFAITSFNLMSRYKFFSVDSTSWIKTAAYGSVIVPEYDVKKKVFDYSKSPFVISVSDISLVKPTTHPHYTLKYSAEEVRQMNEYFIVIGIDPEKLKTNVDERRNANILYYEKLLQSGYLSQKSELKSSRTFF